MGRNVLIHYGVKGMQWGKNNFRNPDGTLNAAGKRRYDVGNTPSTPYVSKEYLQEKAYNSQKNNYGSVKPANQQIKPQTKQYTASTSSTPYVSKEYQRDLAYNSQKNNYGSVKPQTKQYTASTSSTPYVSKEYLQEKAYNSQKNNYGSVKPANQQIKPQTKQYNSNPSSTPYVSEEYQRELAYNSKKNNYGGAKPASQLTSVNKNQSNGSGGISGWVKNAAKDVGNAANKIGSSVSSTANSAYNWGKNAANDVGKAVSGAADSAYNWGKNAANDVGKAVSGAVDGVGKAINANEDYQRTKAFVRGLTDKNPSPTTSLLSYKDQREIDNARINSFKEQLRGKKNNVGYTPTGSLPRANANAAVNNYIRSKKGLTQYDKEYMDTYDLVKADHDSSNRKSYSEREGVFNPRQNFGDAYKAKFVTRPAYRSGVNVRKNVSETANKIGSSVSSAAKDVGDWTKKSAGKVSDVASDSFNKAKGFIGGLFGDNKKKKKK